VGNNNSNYKNMSTLNNELFVVWWQRQTTDSVRKIRKSKASGQTTDSVQKIRKSKASDSVLPQFSSVDLWKKNSQTQIDLFPFATLMNNYTRKWRHFNSKWKHSENTYLLVWWQRQTTDGVRKIRKSKASGQTTDSVLKVPKPSDSVRGFLKCNVIPNVDPGWYDSHVMCAWLSFQLSRIILCCAGFESYIRENFGFFALQRRIVCCLANARQQ